MHDKWQVATALAKSAPPREGTAQCATDKQHTCRAAISINRFDFVVEMDIALNTILLRRCLAVTIYFLSLVTTATAKETKRKGIGFDLRCVGLNFNKVFVYDVNDKYFHSKQTFNFRAMSKTAVLYHLGVCDLLNRDGNVWTVTDDILQQVDLQDIVFCTNPDDTILLETNKTIKPRKCVDVTHSLTIRGPFGHRAMFACPENVGLFRFK